MAASEPDVGLLTSSAQIFAANHSLPQIRAIHKALNGQVDDKAARLRTQVGGSYRELLGTADTIVQMRGHMDTVHATLVGMGGRCGRAVVGAKVTALARLAERAADTADDPQTTLRRAARARLLEACARTAARLLARRPLGMTTTTTTAGSTKQTIPLEPTWGERLVLAAKVLALGRLLVTRLGKETTTDPLCASMETSKQTLGHLRRRLRDLVEALERTVDYRPYCAVVAAAAETAADDSDAPRIGRAAAAAAARRDDLVRALCAHSLATTSGARDVVWQLLNVRSQAMTEALAPPNAPGQEDPDHRAQRVLAGLALYTTTLLDIQTLLPHRLPAALQALQRRALVDDAGLRHMEALALDVHGRWCGADVQEFRPYVRHDDLEAAQARAMRARWAAHGADAVVAGLEAALGVRSGETTSLDLHAVVALRRRVLQRWLRDASRVRGLDPAALLDRLRAVFCQQLLHVLGTKVDKLHLVGSEVTATVAAWCAGVTDRHARLWTDTDAADAADEADLDTHDPLDTALAAGAVPFVRDVGARLHGRSDAVARATAAFRTWRHVLDDATAAVAQLRRQRWEMDADGAAADDEDEFADGLVEDEDTIATRQQRLGRDDPAALEARLATALAAAFAALDQQLAAAWQTVHGSDNDSDSNSSSETAPIAMYLVRVLRAIRHHAPPAAGRQLGLDLVPALHASIVRAVAAPALDAWTTGVLGRRTVAGRSLWELEGGRALPAAPSPGVFRFLRDLSVAMDRAGMDLWSPTAVTALKKHVTYTLAEQWKATVEGLEGEKKEKEEADAEEKQEEDEEKQDDQKEDETPTTDRCAEIHDLLLQWRLDAAWLRCCLGAATQQPAWTALEEALTSRSGLADDAAAQKRLVKAARDYWKRTKLLFGALA